MCGEGILDLGEDCNDGNLVAGDCCSPLCTFEPSSTPLATTGQCGEATYSDGAAQSCRFIADRVLCK